MSLNYWESLSPVGHVLWIWPRYWNRASNACFEVLNPQVDLWWMIRGGKRGVWMVFFFFFFSSNSFGWNQLGLGFFWIWFFRNQFFRGLGFSNSIFYGFGFSHVQIGFGQAGSNGLINFLNFLSYKYFNFECNCNIPKNYLILNAVISKKYMIDSRW